VLPCAVPSGCACHRPKGKEVQVGVKLTMDDFYTCPKKPDDIMPMVCYVRDSIQEILWRHHITAQVKVAPVECKVGGAGGWGRGWGVNVGFSQ
jgi:hypothetical protein